MRVLYISIIALLFLPQGASADSAEAEIEYLLTTIGESGCTFIRNGKRHAADDAEDHLRTKYRRGKRYASTTEEFIRNLATVSSWSKKPYYIDCAGEGTTPTGDWLTAHLSDYRKQQAKPL